MRKICLLLAAVMLISAPLSSFAEGVSTAPAPEFTIIIPDEIIDDGFLLNPILDDESFSDGEDGSGEILPDDSEVTSDDEDVNDDGYQNDEEDVEFTPDDDNAAKDKAGEDESNDNERDDETQDDEDNNDDSQNGEDDEKSTPDEDNTDEDDADKDSAGEDNDTQEDEKDETDPDDVTGEEEEEEVPPIDEKTDDEENRDIELLFLTPMPLPVIDDVFVSAYSGVAEIVVSGDALEGKTIGLKIVPVGNESKIVYARQIEIGSYSGCIVTADLSDNESQLFKLTVEAGDIGRIERFFACGEADKLTCTRTVTGVKIESTADIAAVQYVTVKIMGTDGEVKFVRQIQTDSSGKYSISAQLPDTTNDYIVHVTEGRTGRQYVKTVGMLITAGTVYTAKQTLSGNAGQRKEAIIYAKNVKDTSKYIYEITYDSSVLSIENMNIVGKEVDIISFNNGRIVFTSTNRNNSSKLWAGTINALQFKFLSNSSNANVTLKVYNK